MYRAQVTDRSGNVLVPWGSRSPPISNNPMDALQALLRFTAEDLHKPAAPWTGYDGNFPDLELYGPTAREKRI